MSLAAFEKIGFSMEDIQGTLGGAWDKTKEIANNDYVKYPLIGAGIGGLAMGGASAIGGHGDPENPEKSSDKFKRIGNSALKGAVLGGGAGLGYAALNRAASSVISPDGPKEDPDQKPGDAKYIRRGGAGLGALEGIRREFKNVDRTTNIEIDRLKAEQPRVQQAYDAAFKGDASPVGHDAGTVPGDIAGKLKRMMQSPPTSTPQIGGSGQPGLSPGDVESFVQDELKRNHLGATPEPKGFFEKFKDFHNSSAGRGHRPTTVDLTRDTANIFNSDVASTYADKITNAQPGALAKGYRGLLGAGKGGAAGYILSDLVGRLGSVALGAPKAERNSVTDLK